MAWYPDLSPYEYLGGCPPMLNVGWLERGQDFTTGPAPSELVPRLRKMAERPANLCRGKHVCALCDRPADTHSTKRESLLRFLAWAEERDGNGELHVSAPTGVIYSAPVLLVHYVEVHRYRPPEEFIQAVMTSSSGVRGR
jgi:hypothetical protein